MVNSQLNNADDDQRLRRRGIPRPPTGPGNWSKTHALLASLIFHVTVLVTLGTLLSSVPKGTGAAPDRKVGIAVVQEIEGSEAYFLPQSGSTNLGQTLDSAQATIASLPNASSTGLNSDQILAELLPGDGSRAKNMSAAAGGVGLDEGGPRIGGSRAIPKVKTSVFGIEGEGSRFIYVFDCSDSMNDYDGLPFAAAKRELVQSLQSLSQAHQFQIIFYNDSLYPFGGMGPAASNLLSGDERSKSQASSFVHGKSATGATNHVQALKLAISMGPDVIFFLTDADRPVPSPREREEIVDRCARSGVTLHAIQFGVGPSQGSGEWISALASETSGKFRYIDVTRAGSLRISTPNK